MTDTAAILNEAYGLIEQGELGRARSLLQPLLESDSQNPDVWWLYTNAVDDENEGRRALDRVLALDPQYPGAADLSARLGNAPRVLKPLSSLKPAPVPTTPPLLPVTPVVTSATSTMDDPDLNDDEFAATVGAPQGRRLSGILLIAGAAIIAIGVLWLFTTLANQPAPVTPTAVANLITPVDTALPLAMSTADALTATALLAGSPTTDLNATSVDVTTVTPVVTRVTTSVTVMPAATTQLLATQETVAQVATSEVANTTREPLPAATNAISVATQAMTAAVVPTQAMMTAEVPAATQETILLVTTQDVTATQNAVVMTPTEGSDVIVATATENASIATQAAIPTEDNSLMLTQAVTTEATQDPTDTLAAKLEVLNVTRSNIVKANTGLGSTLIVEVCAPPVASATTALTTAMNALAETVGAVPDVEAVGVNLGCDPLRPRVIAVSASTAAAFGRGEIDLRTYRKEWQPTDLVEAAGNG